MSEPKELGTLVVVVGKAKNLPNKSRFGKQDPFATVTVNEEKQKTKPIKRGGQHPEWDEELRFTIYEDLDDILLRSESQPESLNSSLSSKPLPGQPTPPPKDAGGPAPGAITPALLASKSRKGPLGKKGGKSMKVACYADDAKEPELIGEVTVGIDEVLKKGEVDEWYEFTYKDKYSGEIYLELTFYSNDAPPVKRNVPRPAIHSTGGLYDSFVPSSSSSLNGHARAGGLTTSGSVSGMSLYIPPYVQPSRVSTPQPPVQLPPSASGLAQSHSNSFADLGLPPGHRQRQSMSTLPSQPSFPPTLPSNSALAIDALSRPLSSLSLNPSPSSRPLPSASSPAPPQPGVSGHGYGPHRHSLGGPADAPWASLQQPKPAPTPHMRPVSAQEATTWEQVHRLEEQRRMGATPIPRPESGMTYASSHSTAYEPYDPLGHRASTPTPNTIPSSLQPSGPPQSQPRPHAHSFSGPSRPIVPPPDHSSDYLQPVPPPQLYHASTAPPAPPAAQSSHYQMPTSSFGMLTQPVSSAYRAPSPLPQYPPSQHDQLPVHPSYASPNPHAASINRPISRNDATSPLSHSASQTQQYSGNSTYAPPYEPDRSQTPRPSYPPYNPPAPASSNTQTGWPTPEPQPAPATQATTVVSQGGYVPWYQQTQSTTQAPPQHTQPYGQPEQSGANTSYSQYPSGQGQSYQVSSPPPVPSYRPAPQPPPPRQTQTSVGYYPSDELYVERRHSSSPQPPPRQPSPQPWSQQQQQQQQQPYQGSQPNYPLSPSPSGVLSPPPPPGHHPTSAYSPSHQQPQQAVSPYPPAAASPPRAPPGWQSTVLAYTSSPGQQATEPPSSQNYQAPVQPQRYVQAPTPTRIPSPAPTPTPAPQPQHQYSTGYSPSPNPNYPQSQPLPPAPPPSTQNPYQRSASPLPTQIGQDWKSYMKSLNTPATMTGSTGSSPSPHPHPPTQSYGHDQGQGHGQGQGQGQGQSQTWYTPPPSLPSSIQPPEGWKSTLPAQADGHQWRG